MKLIQLTRAHWVLNVLAAATLAIVPGCGSGGFLGLQDYQRDLITGGLLAAVLANRPVVADVPAEAGVDGRNGDPGVSCWDTNGDGIGDPDEDFNGDGDYNTLDCVGPAGADGATGSPGAPGQDGSSGLNCWDLNGDGRGDRDEDTNGDGNFDALDCQGPVGPPGSDGDPGARGEDGMSLFSIFVDDFFVAPGTPEGDLPVELVSVTEPVLGVIPSVSAEVTTAAAYRVAIPQMYDEGNDVTMRIFFHRTGLDEGGCFIFRLDSKRLRNGLSIEDYGSPRWVRVDLPETAPQGLVAGDEPGAEINALLVVDLPLNTTAGLGFPSLAVSDFLAFELTTFRTDGGAYHLVGVEFAESRPGTAALSGGAVFSAEGEACCAEVPSGPGLSVPDDHLFVSDADTLRVSRITDLSAVVDIAGSLGTSGGYDDGRHMVFDTIGQRIFVSNHGPDFDAFDTLLNPLSMTWGVSLSEPLGMAPLPDGKLLITDEADSTGLFRLVSSSQTVLTLDAAATGSFSFDGAEGVAYDSIHDRIFVADEDDGDIEIFDGPTLGHLNSVHVCSSDGAYWIGVDGSSNRVFMIADTPCPDFRTDAYGIHVFNLSCEGDDLTFDQTLLGTEGSSRDCYGALTVSESTDRLFAIDYCSDTVDIYDTVTLERLGSVSVGRTGELPLMIAVGHLESDCIGDPDCNGNGIRDECDISGGGSEDCNSNGVPDECDIANPEFARMGSGGLLFPLDGTYVPVDFCADGESGSGPAECTGTPTDQHNDDDSATVPLPFSFDLYGTQFNSTFVNNNGNLSFGAFYSTYTAAGFPIDDFPMVAPFWGDVDTGNPENHVGDAWMKFFDGNNDGSDETLVVTWDNVGYYDENGDLRNTFQVAISDGTNPEMGLGNNTCFSYERMEWTTGDASDGVDGFDGSPATVGANAGNGTDFFQIGRFDHPGTDYDGPGGSADGVGYLVGQQICFNATSTTSNINPIPSNFPPGNTVTVLASAGGTLDLDLQFLSPEEGQTTTVTHAAVTVEGTGPVGLNIEHTPGTVAHSHLTYTPDCSQVGTYDVTFTATDDFDPPGVTDVTLRIVVTCVTLDCNTNGVPDECDIRDGTSEDTNGNGIPDECETQ